MHCTVVVVWWGDERGTAGQTASRGLKPNGVYGDGFLGNILKGEVKNEEVIDWLVFV